MSSNSTPLAPAAVSSLASFAGLGSAVTSFGLASNLIAESTLSHSLADWLVWPAALFVALWAALLLTWSVLSFRAGRAVRPGQFAIALSVGLGIELLSFVWQFSQKHLDGGLLATVALQLMLLASLGWLRRQTGSKASQPPAGRLLLTMFATSLVVSAVATAGLAAGTAGQYSIPHDQMQMNFPGLDTGHHH